MLLFITLPGLGNFIAAAIVMLLLNLVAWIRIIIIYKEKGALLFFCWLSLALLISRVWNTRRAITDKNILFLMITFTCLSIGCVFIKFSELPSLLVFVAWGVLIALLALHFFYIEQNIHAYLRVKANDGSINIYKWANDLEANVNWEKVFTKHNNKEFITNSLSLFFRMCAWSATENKVPDNVKFRNAAFNAWIIFNETHDDAINFSFIQGIAANDVFVLSRASQTKSLLVWWIKETAVNALHEQYLITFLTRVQERATYSYEDADEKLRIKDSLCQAIETAKQHQVSPALLAALEITLNQVENNSTGYEDLNGINVSREGEL